MAIDDSILPRLCIVVERRYLQDDKRASFLNLGPFARVEKHGNRCVIDDAEKHEIAKVDLDSLVQSVENWLPKIPLATKLRLTNPTHRLMLLADLVDLLLVAKLQDIQQALRHFNVHFEDTALLQVLKLLDFFKLLKIEYRGSEPFIIRNSISGAPWIDYTAVQGKSAFDRSRFKANCSTWIKADARRSSILEKPQ